MVIERIIELLDKKALKASDLCRFIGINTSTMTNWKNRGTDPPAKFIVPICEFLNVSCEFLLTGKEKSNIHEISNNDIEWLSLIHRLPEKKCDEFKERIKGYLECYEESVAAEKAPQKTGTTNSGK